MKILVTGGRNYSDWAAVYAALDRLVLEYGPLVVIQGGATGADALARDWCAQQPHVSELITEPYRKDLGRAGGPVRNQAMIDKHHPDIVVEFPGGNGTADMVSRARRAGIVVRSGLREKSQ